MNSIWFFCAVVMVVAVAVASLSVPPSVFAGTASASWASWAVSASDTILSIFVELTSLSRNSLLPHTMAPRVSRRTGRSLWWGCHSAPGAARVSMSWMISLGTSSVSSVLKAELQRCLKGGVAAKGWIAARARTFPGCPQRYCAGVAFAKTIRAYPMGAARLSRQAGHARNFPASALNALTMTGKHGGSDTSDSSDSGTSVMYEKPRSVLARTSAHAARPATAAAAQLPCSCSHFSASAKAFWYVSSSVEAYRVRNAVSVELERALIHRSPNSAGVSRKRSVSRSFPSHAHSFPSADARGYARKRSIISTAGDGPFRPITTSLPPWSPSPSSLNSVCYARFFFVVSNNSNNSDSLYICVCVCCLLFVVCAFVNYL